MALSRVVSEIFNVEKYRINVYTEPLVILEGPEIGLRVAEGPPVINLTARCSDSQASGCLEERHRAADRRPLSSARGRKS